MRLYAVLPVLLLGVGCQGGPQLTPAGNSPGQARPAGAAAKPAAAAPPSPAAVAASLVQQQQQLLLAERGAPQGSPAEPPVAQTKHATAASAAAPPAVQTKHAAATTAEPPPAAAAAPASTPPVVRTVTYGPGGPQGEITLVARQSSPSGDLVPARVQTTTTYKHQCDLSVDYLPIRIPFPHLRIFPAPEKVVVQTEYLRGPAAPAASTPTCCPAGRSCLVQQQQAAGTTPQPHRAPALLPEPPQTPQTLSPTQEVLLPPIQQQP